MIWAIYDFTMMNVTCLDTAQRQAGGPGGGMLLYQIMLKIQTQRVIIIQSVSFNFYTFPFDTCLQPRIVTCALLCPLTSVAVCYQED